jgi:hypothetical protein
MMWATPACDSLDGTCTITAGCPTVSRHQIASDGNKSVMPGRRPAMRTGSLSADSALERIPQVPWSAFEVRFLQVELPPANSGNGELILP